MKLSSGPEVQTVSTIEVIQKMKSFQAERDELKTKDPMAFKREQSPESQAAQAMIKRQSEELCRLIMGRDRNEEANGEDTAFLAALRYYQNQALPFSTYFSSYLAVALDGQARDTFGDISKQDLIRDPIHTKGTIAESLLYYLKGKSASLWIIERGGREGNTVSFTLPTDEDIQAIITHTLSELNVTRDQAVNAINALIGHNEIADPQFPEAVQAKLDREGITSDDTRDWLRDLLNRHSEVNLRSSEDLGTVMLYRLRDSLTVGARLGELGEIGLDQLAIRRNFLALIATITAE
ncbi:hypothetical protein A2307_03575 [Candidatus Peregrinibacteria bacterium RIFOXYB2_FULL_33_20]|nr:MAG: hypothetical protein A2307_03575 [Candidatus Peregrinibacteria bacterium RIFOXYB2_FULL_33_20]